VVTLDSYRTPWFYRTTAKAWEIDLNGLKEEIMQLKENRIEAYKIARQETTGVVKYVLEYIPFARRLGLY
jgi:hypothetical protein